ncbi:MAG: hypothetical protein JSS04_13615 [Proteobacteria bacterium]|nr:hypothetical protein [Pseudomonadota bacterium]
MLHENLHEQHNRQGRYAKINLIAGIVALPESIRSRPATARQRHQAIDANCIGKLYFLPILMGRWRGNPHRRGRERSQDRGS